MQPTAIDEAFTNTITEAMMASKDTELRAKDKVIGTMQTSSSTVASINFNENENGI